MDQSDEAPLKVIDFGLSKVFQSKEGEKVHMSTRAGTPYYIAPEVLQGNYDELCDIWSAGILISCSIRLIIHFKVSFYTFCCAVSLHSMEIRITLFLRLLKRASTTLKVRRGPALFAEISLGDEWKHVSKGAKDLIKKMICPVDERLTAREVLEDPWMKEVGSADEQPLPVNFGSLKNFRNSEKLKKATLTFIATQCSENEIRELSKIFQSLDKDGDGVLTMDELKNGYFPAVDSGL